MENNKVRDQFIVSKIRLLKEVLKPFETKERLSYTELREQTTLKGGTFAAAFKDAKILRLVHKNGSLTITPDGQVFLKNNSQDFFKKIGLQVPLFRQMLDNNITSRPSIEHYITDALKLGYNERTLRLIIGQTTLRYLEFIVGMDAKKARLPTKRIVTDTNHLDRAHDLFKTVEILLAKGFKPEEITHATHLKSKEKNGGRIVTVHDDGFTPV